MTNLPPHDPDACALHEAELRKLRKINRVLMDRVERDMDSQGGDACSLLRTAITLEARVSERTTELSKLTHQLMHEISERHEAEKALLAAKAEAEQANLGKTRFLAAAMHDLCQPLNAARLFLGALADELESERHRDLLGRIDSALDTVDELLGTLLDISKLDPGVWPVTLGNVAIGPMLSRLAEEYRPQAHGAGLDLRVVPCGAIVHTDQHLFERVLRNLISNAIRYTAEGRILVGWRRRGNHLIVQVWDTGVGIPTQMRRQIFEEFQRLGYAPRREGKGLGLGLAIVDRIARMLDLGIEVTSTVGRGSCFSVTVPIAAATDDPAWVPVETIRIEPPGLKGRTIVVVDNDEFAIDAMRAVLNGWGCQLVGAASCQEAVERLAADALVPDLVVADYHLDRGACGTDVITTLRRRYGNNLPALVVSGDRSMQLRASLKASGHAFLAKPVSPARLRAMINYLVNPPTDE